MTSAPMFGILLHTWVFPANLLCYSKINVNLLQWKLIQGSHKAAVFILYRNEETISEIFTRSENLIFMPHDHAEPYSF